MVPDPSAPPPAPPPPADPVAALDLPPPPDLPPLSLPDERPRPLAADDAPPPVTFDPFAAVLSYMIPGLGQVYQGRIGKGLLFFFGLYALFFYGMWMGQWRNVWLPDSTDPTLPDVEVAGQRVGGVAKAVWHRPQFMGQFWIGTAAWPAVSQYLYYDKDKAAGPLFGAFERVPTEDELNALQRDGNKRWDLGWVYTVIAGVLNLLVIYDALAGPMFRDPPPGPAKPDDVGDDTITGDGR